uniref:Thioredoxin domain-containing protein n=1 Tax=Hucho hucho TaxID=62062 RepID=A0A4W5LVS8_9TELE
MAWLASASRHSSELPAKASIARAVSNKLRTRSETSMALPSHISRNDIPVVVDFWAPWCGPCQMMTPAFAQAAAALPQVRFAKINTQTETTLGQRFNIRSIPTLVLFIGLAQHNPTRLAAKLAGHEHA